MKHLLFCLLLTSTLCAAADRELRHIEVPIYPPLARQARVQGTVTVTLKVASDGKVTSATTEGGHAILQDYAAANAQTWTFAPRSTESREIVSYVFAFIGDEQYSSASSVVFDLPNKVEIHTTPPKPIIDSITIRPKKNKKQ
jgi:TonB family protein